jgi:hypothetical protein
MEKGAAPGQNGAGETVHRALEQAWSGVGAGMEQRWSIVIRQMAELLPLRNLEPSLMAI